MDHEVAITALSFRFDVHQYRCRIKKTLYNNNAHEIYHNWECISHLNVPTKLLS